MKYMRRGQVYDRILGMIFRRFVMVQSVTRFLTIFTGHFGAFSGIFLTFFRLV